MFVPAGTIAATSQPSADFSVRRSANEAASYEETLMDENSFMARTLLAVRAIHTYTVDTAAMQAFSSLLAIVVVFASAALVLARILSGRVVAAARLYELGAGVGLWLAAAIAIGATAGSLYFSEIAGFVPCRLCWYQRIAMYPLAVIGIVAALRRDRDVVWYAVPLASIGAGIAAYHYLIEWRPALDTGACSANGPACTDIWFREFGFVTLAFMALAGFIGIITFTLAAAGARSRSEIE